MEAALTIAEEQGWPAVSTHRLAEAIEYSQPVLYQHFRNRDDLIRAIAVDGFATLTDLIQASAAAASAPLEEVCRAYLDVAHTQPRAYEAMFSLPTAIRFDSPDTPAVVRDTFCALTVLIEHEHHVDDPDAAADFFWASCHGLATLMAAGRIPEQRIELHIAMAARSFART